MELASLSKMQSDDVMIIDPQELESKFLEAEQTLDQMIRDRYIPDVDSIVDDVAFTGGSNCTANLKSFLSEAAATWESFVNGNFQGNLLPIHIVEKDIYLTYNNIFDEYGDNMQKLALKTASPLNMGIFSQVYSEIDETGHCEQALTDALRRTFFKDETPGAIFTITSILIKNICISTVEYIYSECQHILTERETPTTELTANNLSKEELDPDNIGMTPESTLMDELLPSAHLSVSDKFLIPNSRIANMFNEVIGASNLPVRVSPKSRKKPITVMLDIVLKDPNVTISGKYEITDYDKWVYSNISTIYVCNGQNCVMTPAMIYRRMHNMDEAQYISPGQLAAVDESIWKMQQLHAKIDCTEQARDRKLIKKNETLVLDDDLLNIKELTKAKINGNIVTTGKIYQLLSVPILYQYSSLIKQVLTAPASMADIRSLSGERVRANKNRDLIFAYLLKRILGMKGENALNQRTIALYGYNKDGRYHKGLYDIIGPRSPNRTEAKRIREYISAILDQWTAQKEIKGWKWYKRGQKIMGMEIAV